MKGTRQRPAIEINVPPGVLVDLARVGDQVSALARRNSTAHGTSPRRNTRSLDQEADRRCPGSARGNSPGLGCLFAPYGSEAVLGCEILNRMTALGRPVSYRIGR